MKGPRVVKASVLENKPTKIAVRCNDVVGFFFLTKFVTIIVAFVFSCFTYKARCDKRSMHRTKKTATEYTRHAKHVEWVHENVVLRLEHEHVIESSRDTQRHSVREGTLTKRIHKEYGRGCSDWSRIGNTNPRPHSESITKFPFSSHVSEHTDEEVEYHELVGTSIIEPLTK